MNIALWVCAAVLALIFAAAGVTKLTKDRQQLAESGQGWAEDVSDGLVKGIGIAEVLAAIGLIVPALVDVAPWLTGVAAAGAAVLMAGAVVVHARRREIGNAAFAGALAVLAIFVAIGRLGIEPF